MTDIERLQNLWDAIEQDLLNTTAKELYDDLIAAGCDPEQLVRVAREAIRKGIEEGYMRRDKMS